MFFSVLIPVYNVGKYIRQCIDSILLQDEQDFEIVLVDDGSTDDSGMICDEYAQKYPDRIHVIHKENEGLLLTRRRAIRESKGEWLVHLDADDYMLPGALKKVRQTVIEHNADLLVGNYVRGQSDAEDLSHTEKIPFRDLQVFEGFTKHDFLMQFLYGGRVTAIWQKIAKRDIVDVDADYQPFGFVNMMEDHLQSLALLNNANRIVYINFPLIYYRYNESSITKRKGFASYCAAYRSVRTAYLAEGMYRAKWNLSEEENGRILAKHFRVLSSHLQNVVLSASPYERASFIESISADMDLKEDYLNANKSIMGKKSTILFFLAFHKCNHLIHYFCKIGL
ncbi:MAG: glycosyltransferase family 2 protein [Lachnospiraceae bacterium]|nr:glycosyltransferase family 2 protein [Lachnospiraceae bacterium]